MSCEIHDDSWHCFLQEGQWMHIKKEEWKSSIEFKPNTPDSYNGKELPKGHMDDEFNPFGKIFDILNGKE